MTSGTRGLIFPEENTGREMHVGLSIVATAILLPFLAGAAAAQSMPPEVATRVAELQSNCRAMKKEPPPTASFVTRLDFTGDGIEDWLIDTAGIGCAGFSGAGGSSLEVYVGANGRATKAFDGMSFQVTIEKNTRPPVIWIGLGGRYCGDNRNVAQAMLKTCKRPLVWNRGTKQFDLGPMAPL